MLTNWQFALIFVGVALLGGLLFFLTGFIRVYKGRVAIIERVGQFVGLYKPGIYYFAPRISPENKNSIKICFECYLGQWKNSIKDKNGIYNWMDQPGNN